MYNMIKVTLLYVRMKVRINPKSSHHKEKNVLFVC